MAFSKPLALLCRCKYIRNSPLAPHCHKDNDNDTNAVAIGDAPRSTRRLRRTATTIDSSLNQSSLKDNPDIQPFDRVNLLYHCVTTPRGVQVRAQPARSQSIASLDILIVRDKEFLVETRVYTGLGY